jgi:uncharacterized protein YbaR (Trm112 family)
MAGFKSCKNTKIQKAGMRLDYHHPMDSKLLELLVCPVTKGHLDWDKERQELLSRSARLAYPVRNGIPILLENEARAMTDEELEALQPRTPLV